MCLAQGKDYHWCTSYEILGDDIMIFDKELSDRYLFFMKYIGVECNLSKSLLSPNSTALEFAKRTIYKGEDVSALPWKLFASVGGSLGGKISLLRDLFIERKHPLTVSTLFSTLHNSQTDLFILAKGGNNLLRLKDQLVGTLRSLKRVSLGYLFLILYPFSSKGSPEHNTPVKLLLERIPEIINKGDFLNVKNPLIGPTHVDKRKTQSSKPDFLKMFVKFTKKIEDQKWISGHHLLTPSLNKAMFNEFCTRLSVWGTDKFVSGYARMLAPSFLKHINDRVGFGLDIPGGSPSRYHPSFIEGDLEKVSH